MVWKNCSKNVAGCLTMQNPAFFQLHDLTFPYAFDKDVDRTASVEFGLSLLLRLFPEDCMSPLIIFEFFLCRT